MKKKLIAIQQDGSVGGSGLGLLAILRMLNTKFDITVYCPESKAGMPNLFREYGINVVTTKSIPTFLYHSGGPSIISPAFWVPLLRILKEKKFWRNKFAKLQPDYVLVNSMVLSWMLEPIKSSRAKAICHVREVLPNRWNLRSRKILNNLNGFDAVWFISEHEKKFFDLQKPFTSVIRDCPIEAEIPDPKYTRQRTDNEDVLKVLYVGGLSKLKGLNVLLESLRYLDDRIKVFLAGSYSVYDPRERPLNWRRSGYFKRLLMLIEYLPKMQLEKELKKAQLEFGNRIVLVGHKNDLSELFIECDVLVFPSTKPHQSRPAFEIGFYSKPVIISNYGQTKEYIMDGYNGLTFDPRNARDLAQKIDSLATDLELCFKLGKNNYDLSLRNHSYDAVENEVQYFFRIINN